MPIPIKLGTKEIDIPLPDGAPKDQKPKKEIIDDIINNSNPAWTKTPKDLNDEDYNNFYRELYPSQFEPPLFNIHLNVDYPFHLTGILYFPKINNDINIQKDKIQLYQNQVFVTDNVEGIVPEFLTLLRGVIDSPDIPLNVSRSYLQADGAVKKISNYITRKVADKLNSLFKKDRKGFEDKWNDIKVVIEYGMLSEDKFFEKADKFSLYPTSKGEFYTYAELEEKIKPVQTDKDDKLIILYTNDIEEQHSYIKNAEEKGYTVLLLDSPIISHLIQKMETTKEKISFCRIDGDSIENLIKKDEAVVSKLSDKQKDKLKPMIEEFVKESGYMVQLEAMESKSLPFVLAQPEFMRRMKEMQQTGGGGMMGGNMPGMYTLLVNTNHELISQILETKTGKKRERLINQGLDLAKLSQGLLKGEALTKFLQRSLELIK
jgi:molecular chaperone HtpG